LNGGGGAVGLFDLMKMTKQWKGELWKKNVFCNSFQDLILRSIRQKKWDDETKVDERVKSETKD
jgi:hypothetical protein